jgi:hypothetical protein
MRIIYDRDSSSILVTITHQVDDLSTHYVKEIELKKNGVTVDTLTYTSQPSPETFTYRYLLPLHQGDTGSVTAMCNIGGSITRQITVPGSIAPVPGGVTSAQPVSYATLWPVHATLMMAGFLCLLAAALFPAFLKGKSGWFIYHTRFAAGGAILTLTALGIAFYMVSLSGGPHIRVPHAYLGLLILVVLVLTISLALLRTRVRPHTMQILTAHRWMGRTLLLLMAANILSGLFTAGILS